MLVDEYNHLVVTAVVVAAVAGYGVPFSSCFCGDLVVDVLFLFEIDPKKIKKNYFLFFVDYLWSPYDEDLNPFLSAQRGDGCVCNRLNCYCCYKYIPSPSSESEIEYVY